VDAPGDLGLGGDLARDLGGEFRPQALALVHEGELAELLFGVAVELAALDGDLGLGQLALRRHGRELTGGHRAGAGDDAREAGEDHRVGGGAAAHHTGDEGEVRDEPVHHAEGGGAEPAAGHIAVRAVQLGGDGVKGVRGMRGHLNFPILPRPKPDGGCPAAWTSDCSICASIFQFR
jgi:hypothetical protein